MKLKRQLKKTFRSFLVFVMVFLISGSSLNFAFATYGILVPDGDSQKVNIDHIWVDSDNKGNTRPDSVKEEVTAKDGEGESVDFVKKDEPDNTLDKDVITDDGSTAGKEAGAAAADKDKGNVEIQDGILKPSNPNPGKDDGFQQGYEDGYKEVMGDDAEIQWPVEDPDNPAVSPDDPAETPDDPANPPDDPAETPDDPAETPDDPANPPDDPAETPDDPANPPDDPAEKPEEQPKDESLSKLDPEIADAIEGILNAKDDNSLVIQNPSDPAEVDGEMAGKVEDVIKDQMDPSNGNTWHETEDYVAQVEDKDGLHYEVELPQETKDQLKDAGYESVQLKITYETVFAVKDDTGTVYIDPYTGKELSAENRVLAICQHVSYDGGKTWQSVGEPRFEYKNGDPYKYVDDETKTSTSLTWDKYVSDLKHADYNEETKEVVLGEAKTEEEKAEVAAKREYDPARDYVQETTYTFLHVLRDPKSEDPTPNDPKDPPKEETPKTPEDPGQEVPEDPVPLAPPEEDPLVDVPETDVPMTTVPRTGDISSVWTMLALLSVTGLLGVTLLERKKADNS